MILTLFYVRKDHFFVILSKHSNNISYPKKNSWANFTQIRPKNGSFSQDLLQSRRKSGCITGGTLVGEGGIA